MGHFRLRDALVLFFGIVGIITSFLFITTVLLYMHDKYLMHKKKMPVGPLSLPIVGGLYLLDRVLPHISVDSLFQYYGSTFSIRLGQTDRVVMTKDMDIIKHVLRRTCAANRPDVPFMKFLNQGYGQGIGSIKYGQKWKIHTTVCHAAIANLTNVKSEDIIDQPCQELIDRFKDKGNEPFDPVDIHHEICFNCVETLVYGHSYSEVNLQQKMYDHEVIMKHLAPTHPINVMPWIKYLPLKSTKDLLTALNHRDLYLRKTYQEHESELHATDNRYHDVTEAVIISKLNTSEEYIVKTLEANNVLLTLWALNVAGIDTMKTMMTWIILYLGLNQHVVQKAQKILKKTIGDRMPNAADQNDLPYISAIVAETQRIVSPVTLGLPRCTTEDLHFSQFTIPKETTIFPCTWSVHHDPELWPEPFQFKPDRFLKPDGTLKNLRNIYGFIPYGYGIRMCTGNYYANAVLFVFTAKILQKFDLKIPSEKNIDLRGSISMNLDPPPFKIVLNDKSDQ